MEKVCGIYKIVNKENGKIYVGQSRNIHRRMTDLHKGCKYLFHAIKKYGKENFESSVVEYCDISELNDREKYWIKKLDSHVSGNGYNVSWGGLNSMEGRKHTEESKKKISDAVKGENHPLWGKKQSEESNRKNRESQLGEKSHCFGKHLTDEHKKKVGDSQRGEKNHMFGRIGTNNPNFGKKKENATSKYFGVYFRSRIINDRVYEYWCVTVKLTNGKMVYGQTNSETDSAKLVDKIIIENNLNYPLNFPEEYR